MCAGEQPVMAVMAVQASRPLRTQQLQGHLAPSSTQVRHAMGLEIFIQNIRMFVKYYKCLCINEFFLRKRFNIK